MTQLAETAPPKGIVIAFDQATLDDPQHEHADLALKYSPYLVLFPPPREHHDARPYPDGVHDYQPRPVEQLLDDARLVKTFRGSIIEVLMFASGLALTLWASASVLIPVLSALLLLAIFGPGWVTEALKVLGPDWATVIFGPKWAPSLEDSPSSVWGVLRAFLWTPQARELLILVLLGMVLIRRGFHPVRAVAWIVSHLRGKPASEAKERLRKNAEEGLSEWELRVKGGRAGVWTRYVELESKPSPTNHPACYVNIVNKPHGTPGLAIEYWFFYFADDMVNVHLADWELVTVLFKRDLAPGHVSPVSCAYSAHMNGRLREWEHVTTIEETHPIVYVARGSHAHYFDPKPLGFETGATVNEVALGMPGLIRAYSALKGTFIGHSVRMSTTVTQEDPEGTTRDYVAPVRFDQEKQHFFYLDDTAAAPPIEPLREGATMHIFPYYPETDVVPYNHNPLWDKWWWLRYKGLWGMGIKGPPFQGDRWSDPWQWSRRLGMPDMTPEWQKMLL